MKLCFISWFLSEPCSVFPCWCPGAWSMSCLNLVLFFFRLCTLFWAGSAVWASLWTQGAFIAFALGHFMDRANNSVLKSCFDKWRLRVVVDFLTQKALFIYLALQREGAWSGSANLICNGLRPSGDPSSCKGVFVTEMVWESFPALGMDVKPQQPAIIKSVFMKRKTFDSWASGALGERQRGESNTQN